MVVLGSSVVRCGAVVLRRHHGRLHDVRIHVSCPHRVDLLAVHVVVLLLLLLLIVEVGLVLLFGIMSLLRHRLIHGPINS